MTLLYKAILIFSCITMVICLSGYVYYGSFMRYSGDDYCYGAVLTKFGLWGAQTYSYNNPVPFHGNRYSLTLFSTTASLFNPAFNGVLPGLAIVSWIIGLFYLISSVLKKLNFQLLKYEVLLISEFIVFITLYAAPDLPESLYWRSGMLPYLAPIILDTYLAGLVFNYQPRTRLSGLYLFLILLLAFINGGFSETATGLQAGGLILWFIGTLFTHKKSGLLNREFKVPLAFALAGTTIATILLISAPTIESELSTSGFTQNVLQSSVLTFRYAWGFVIDSLRSVPLPHFIALGFSALLSFFITIRDLDLRSQKINRMFIYAGLVIITSYFIIACCIAPAAFIRSVKPNPRGLITTRFVMMAAFLSIGWLIGQTLSPLLNGKKRVQTLLNMGSLLLLLLICLYSLRAARSTYSSDQHYQKWARFWDIRDLNIRKAKSLGVQNIEVMHLDKVIQWVGELSGNPDDWYNRCAAEYYGVKSISAIISVWDQ